MTMVRVSGERASTSVSPPERRQTVVVDEDTLEPWVPDEEDVAFYDLYGPWAAMDPSELLEAMTGFPEPWWVVGGHAIEAFTQQPRVHEDIDVAVFTDAVPALRRQLGDRFHLWSNAGGTFRVIDDRHPDPLEPISQVWVRRSADSPWLIDFQLNPVRDGQWVSKRDAKLVADLDDVTWIGNDGVRYMTPEMVMYHKALQDRVKDLWDLRQVLPRLIVRTSGMVGRQRPGEVPRPCMATAAGLLAESVTSLWSVGPA